MMNTKSLWFLMALVSLVVTAIGLMRFTVDLWSYFHASAGRAASSNNHLNYTGLGAVSAGVVMFVLFIFLYRKKGL